ncbi:MAG: tetratricopeptide repeat protein [Rubrobacter sp.]|nr:tetratricopeptide repeat protein [Rubrobacter sp.]
MASLKIDLFGEFVVRRGPEVIERREWGRQKTRSLLKLLLTRCGYVFSRDEIIESLWPGVSPKAAERSLRVTVSLLRRVLEPDLERGSESRYVLQRRPGYSFDHRADCEVDAWEFEKRQKRAEAARESGELDEAIREYRAALDLARGEFLSEDAYEEWAAEVRQGWQERHLCVLSELAECLALKGRYTEAIEVCDRAVTMDRYREESQRRLMLYYYCAGEQNLALRAFRSYSGTLREELGADPSPELVRLKEHVEAREVPGVDEARRYPRPRRPMRFPYSLSRTHFVGRDGEYALLAERLRDASRGSGGAVAVEGEAGVGKTRLVEEFLGYAGSRGFRVLSGRCYERELGPPLEPVIEALGPPVTEEEAGSWTPEEESGYAWRSELREDNSRTYGTLTRKLVERARGEGSGGVVLFVDDVQWADPATLDFFSYAARRVSGERVLLVFTYRREDAPGISEWLDHFAERRAVSTLSLGRLSPEDTTELIGRMSSRDFGGLAALSGFLYRESEGNPFYAVEYLRWLIESGAVEIDSRRRIRALESELLRESTLPSGVRSLLRARFGGLEEEARDLLKLAAVIGRRFDLGLLCGAAGCGTFEALDIAEPLMGSGLIVEAPEGEEYYFAHDKLRQALYEDISRPRLRRLHLRVAEALEGAGGEPGELAHHYLQAREWRPALENLVRAAKRAEEGYAWKTALRDYTRALEVVEKLPGAEGERFELLGAQENLLEHLGRREERAEVVEEMSGLARRMGDRAGVAGVHVRRIGVLAALADPEGAAEAGREALAIFRELGERAGEARVHREVGYVRLTNGDYAGALEATFEALRIHRELGDRRGEAGAAGNLAQLYRGKGDYDDALYWAEEAARIDRELGDRLGEAFRLNIVAAIHRERGDLEVALSLHSKSMLIVAELGVKNLSIAEHSNCGTIHLSLGDLKEALKHFRAAVRLSQEIGYTRDEGYSLMSSGLALEQLGDPAGAADAYRRSSDLLETSHEDSGMPGELYGRADALALLGGVRHHSLDRPADAMEAYEEAAGICRRLGEANRLLKLLMSLAGLYWRTGSPEDSARGYEEALDLAREHGETAQEAAALMSLSVVHRELGCPRESLRCGKAALGMLRELGDLQAEAYVLSSMAESHSGLGQYPSALSCLKRSLQLRRRVGDVEGEAGVLHDLARAYEDLGNTGRAQAASGEAARKESVLGRNHSLSGAERRA